MSFKGRVSLNQPWSDRGVTGWPQERGQAMNFPSKQPWNLGQSWLWNKIGYLLLVFFSKPAIKQHKATKQLCTPPRQHNFRHYTNAPKIITAHGALSCHLGPFGYIYILIPFAGFNLISLDWIPFSILLCISVSWLSLWVAHQSALTPFRPGNHHRTERRWLKQCVERFE